MINLEITREIKPDAWRKKLDQLIKPKEQINARLGELSFTETRVYLAILNAVALVRQCQVKYADETEWHQPPLVASYHKPPTITSPTV